MCVCLVFLAECPSTSCGTHVVHVAMYRHWLNPTCTHVTCPMYSARRCVEMLDVVRLIFNLVVKPTQNLNVIGRSYSNWFLRSILFLFFIDCRCQTMLETSSVNSTLSQFSQYLRTSMRKCPSWLKLEWVSVTWPGHVTTYCYCCIVTRMSCDLHVGFEEAVGFH